MCVTSLRDVINILQEVNTMADDESEPQALVAARIFSLTLQNEL